MNEIFRLFLQHNPIYVFIKDEDIRPIHLSKNYEKMLGRPLQEILGKSMDELFPFELSRAMIEDDKKILREGIPHEFIEELGDRTYSTLKFPIFIEGKAKYLAGYTTDITESKQAQDQLKASLREKEILLKEIHHRVKNNLQVISGLLTLQAAQIDDERLLRVIKESQSRIWTMALIHQTLYQSGNLAGIDMGDYIRQLSSNLLSSHAQVAMPPTLHFDLIPLQLAIDKAIPLALIVNELLINAVKHAFSDGRTGDIRIVLRECRDKSRRVPIEDIEITPKEGMTLPAYTHQLSIADNGIGLPQGFNAANQKSLGLQLVAMLAKQIEGKLRIESGHGTSVRIIFTVDEANKKHS
jgi:PAS domain S-box-containing protein